MQMYTTITGLWTAPPTLGFGLPGGSEWVILLILGLLIFGRRLPEVGRSLGRGIVEFKKGIKGIEEDIETESSPGSTDSSRDEIESKSSQPSPKNSGEPHWRELPKPARPAEARVSRGDDPAAHQQVEARPAEGDADRDSS